MRTACAKSTPWASQHASTRTLPSFHDVWQTPNSRNAAAVGLAGTNLGVADNSPYLVTHSVALR